MSHQVTYYCEFQRPPQEAPPLAGRAALGTCDAHGPADGCGGRAEPTNAGRGHCAARDQGARRRKKWEDC